MLPKKVLSRIVASRVRQRRPYPSARQPRKLIAESLETRLLLTASTALPDLPAEVEQPTAALTSESSGTAGAASFVHNQAAPGAYTQFQLRIEGTGVQFSSSTGLPEHLEGNVYYVGGHVDGQYAGTYQEDIVPILHPDYGLIGADGIGTYSFSNHRGVTTLGKLVVEYRSYIVGIAPTGAVLVNSAGSTVDGTRVFHNLEGGFTTNSSVMLGGEFAMHVEVSMQLSRTLPAEARQALERLSASEPHDAVFREHGEQLERHGGSQTSGDKHDRTALAVPKESWQSPFRSLRPDSDRPSQTHYAGGVDRLLAVVQPLWLHDALALELTL